MTFWFSWGLIARKEMSMRSKSSVIILLLINALLMLVLVGSDFYSLFTDQFYVLKKENYLMLLLALPYFLYLIVFGIKLFQEEGTDPGMRVLEYIVYCSLALGLWQVWTVFQDWNQYAVLKDQFLLPDSFYPVGIGLLVSFGLLYLLSVYMFVLRHNLIGRYHPSEWEENFEDWEEFSLEQKSNSPVNEMD